MLFSLVMQFVYSLKKQQQNVGVGEDGGRGQEQRDRRAKF